MSTTATVVLPRGPRHRVAEHLVTELRKLHGRMGISSTRTGYDGEYGEYGAEIWTVIDPTPCQTARGHQAYTERHGAVWTWA